MDGKSVKTKETILTIFLILDLFGVGIFVGLNFEKFGELSSKVATTLANNSSSSSSQIQNSTVSSSQNTKPEFVVPNSMEVRTLFFGDVFWGRYVEDWSNASPLKIAYPFSGLSTFNKENYQAWIGSLNCPITTNTVTSKQQDQLLEFNCRPEYLAEAKKWFDVFSLANSHTENMDGLVGFESTKKYLQENDIQFFGHYDKQVENDICEVVSIPVKVDYSPEDLQKQNTQKTDNYLLPVALCGYHNTFALPTDSQLSQISKYSSIFPTFVYAIQGSEYLVKADGLQKQYLHLMVDKGADAVIGKGAHVVQNTEVYKGKLIVYSMGNFVYDQQFSPDVTQGIAVDMDLKIQYDQNFQAWQEIAKSCLDFKDSCLEKAKSKGLQKVKFSSSYNIIATDNSKKLAKKASPEIQQKMLGRTNWEKTQTELSKQ